jgi:hypothetical protein
MNSLATKLAPTKGAQPVASVLLLRATDDGWALIDAQGEVVFAADGQRGRQACLAFARDAGVLALNT